MDQYLLLKNAFESLKENYECIKGKLISAEADLSIMSCMLKLYIPPTPKDIEQILFTYDEMSIKLNIPKGTLQQMVHYKKIPFIPELKKFRNSDIIAWLDDIAQGTIDNEIKKQDFVNLQKTS